MEQIPKILIIGSGRLASHLKHYFSLLKITYYSYSRSEGGIENHPFLAESEIICLAISDDSIKEFIENNPIIQNKSLVHFSGANYIEGVLGAHPLMTFSKKLYKLEDYKKIPFVVDGDIDLFHKYFPLLDNKIYKIDRENKAYYHSLCVIGSNFMPILLKGVLRRMRNNLRLNEEALIPLLQRSFENFIDDHNNSLTGPLVRGDKITIAKNLAALENDNFLNIYKSFLEYWEQENENK